MLRAARQLVAAILAGSAILLGASVGVAFAHRVGVSGADVLHWNNADITRVVAPAFANGNLGLTRFANGPAQVLDIAGRACLRGSLFLMDVRDALARDIDETVELDIEFETDSKPTPVTLVYDKNGAAGGVIAINVPAADTPSGSAPPQFHSEHLVLDRARFAGLGDFNTDLMISTSATTTICSITVSPSFSTPQPAGYGWLEVTVTNEHGKQTPARLGLYDSTGRTPLPSDAALKVEKFDDVRQLALMQRDPGAAKWPSDNPWIFYTDGVYRARVPAGDYKLIAAKGIEYRVATRSTHVAAGQTRKVSVRLDRWRDLPGTGWYSGDVHIHLATRDAADRQAVLTHAQAEDVHVANTLRMGNMGATHFPQSAWGKAGRHGADSFTVAPGQEDPRTAVLGHTIHLDLPEPVRNPARYLLYRDVFERVAELGGVSGYAHVFGYGGGSRTDVGLAVDAPSGLVDFVEVLQAGLLGTDLWFDLLNLGFQLGPAAGSDYPYLGLLGSVRTYVQIDGGYSPDAWFDNLAKGRTFVTNGPVVDLTVNGKGIGSRIELQAGDTLSISADASINPDIDLLQRLVLIEQGKVVAEAAAEKGKERLSLAYKARAGQGTWFVVRASGLTKSVDGFGYQQTVQAISAPVYVSVNGERTWRKDQVAGIARRQIDLLDQLATTMLKPTSGAEYWEDAEPLLSQGQQQLKLLSKRIDEARQFFRALIEEAR